MMREIATYPFSGATIFRLTGFFSFMYPYASIYEIELLSI